MVDKAAESITTLDRSVGAAWRRVGRFEAEAAVGALGVVVLEVVGDDAFEVPLAGDECPVEAFAADRLHEAFGVGVRGGRSDRGEDDADAVGLEVVSNVVVNLLSRSRIRNQKRSSCPFHRQVPGLLGDPSAVGVGAGAGQWTRRVPCAMKNRT